ncbi:alpha/beta hydrolase [uncultured Psychroserpens sp.]|uniref:alpha/beta hydrolase n=1 Tax=uncultured Psychroserpens sp. TaxID=255436 RepID=UPI002602E337|nr:alpha/beta hydrolase [uncultured Psychroserpens sp.]
MKYYLIITLVFNVFVASAQNKRTFTYAVKALDRLKLDVYTPEDIEPDQKLPVLIWMHGGGFSGGSREGDQELRLMEYIAAKGIIGVSISYRLLRRGTKTGFGCQCSKEEKLYTFAMAAEDFLDATNFIVDKSDSLHIDASKIIAGGSSAGAEAVLSAVYMKDYFIENTSVYDDIKFAGVLSYAGAMVDESYITEANAVPTILFHGSKDDLVPYAKAPHHFCDEDDPGFLVLNGSDIIFRQLEQLNTSYYLYKVENGKHEVATIVFEHLDPIMSFISHTIIDSKVIQTKQLEVKE